MVRSINCCGQPEVFSPLLSLLFLLLRLLPLCCSSLRKPLAPRGAITLENIAIFITFCIVHRKEDFPSTVPNKTYNFFKQCHTLQLFGPRCVKLVHHSTQILFTLAHTLLISSLEETSSCQTFTRT